MSDDFYKFDPDEANKPQHFIVQPRRQGKNHPKFMAGDVITNSDKTIYQTVHGRTKTDYIFDDAETRTRWYMPIKLVDLHWTLVNTDEEAEIIDEE